VVLDCGDAGRTICGSIQGVLYGGFLCWVAQQVEYPIQQLGNKYSTRRLGDIGMRRQTSLTDFQNKAKMGRYTKK
jgi:hypothetical protein